MNLEKRIGVIMGGNSREREISLETGNAVLDALKSEGANVVSIDAGDSLVEKLVDERIELAFIALHGKFGEDGTVQGLLESMEIPYTGSGVLASALAMDKIMSKRVFQAVGLPTPRFEMLERGAMQRVDPAEITRISPPLVVKPSGEGSTLGVSIIRGGDDLAGAVDLAFGFDERIIVEEFVEGSELTVGILNGRALPVIEIVASRGFYDFHAKYASGETRYILPAEIDAKMTETLQDLALRTHRTLGCRGVSRVDFRLDKRSGVPYILELNTIPGLTKTSLLPKAAAYVGCSFTQLVLKILKSACLGMNCNEC